MTLKTLLATTVALSALLGFVGTASASAPSTIVVDSSATLVLGVVADETPVIQYASWQDDEDDEDYDDEDYDDEDYDDEDYDDYDDEDYDDLDGELEITLGNGGIEFGFGVEL